jgi:phage terminase small subunit
MPILSNPRHEKFAQSLAAGKSATEAMADAGYADPRNSTRLTKNDEIRARVDELLDRAAANVQVSREWVLERLVENANRAMQVEEIKKPDGTGTGEYKYEGNVANRALELVGKELGMFVDRKEVGKPGEFDGLTVEQKRERVVGIAKQLGVDRIGTPAGSA